MNKKLVIFNLKMNAPVLANWRKVKKLKADLVVCPPFVYIPILKTENYKLKIGAQNVFWANGGAYTGEVSPAMLKSLGAEYTIIGHSERRQYLGETDEMINKKILAALKSGLKVVLCVGENLAIRKRGAGAAKDFVKNQLQKDIKNCKSKIENLIIAYEPVWAIGTGKACKPEDALEMIKFIRNFLSSKFSAKGGSRGAGQVSSFKILYGGSVNEKNVSDFVKYKDIDGVLVGGASLKSKEVLKIIKKVG